MHGHQHVFILGQENTHQGPNLKKKNGAELKPFAEPCGKDCYILTVSAASKVDFVHYLIYLLYTHYFLGQY